MAALAVVPFASTPEHPVRPHTKGSFGATPSFVAVTPYDGRIYYCAANGIWVMPEGTQISDFNPPTL